MSAIVWLYSPDRGENVPTCCGDEVPIIGQHANDVLWYPACFQCKRYWRMSRDEIKYLRFKGTQAEKAMEAIQ
jgi:hypothetical protein